MKIIQKRNIPSERIKCLYKFNNYIVCGLFTGTLIFISDNMIKKQIKVGTKAIRSLAKLVRLVC